ncbi:MAG: dihydrolipoamide acetyltransferase family protein [Anaerolineales bacterium]|jgi:pyruvate dehydrogenase E2 component (dihydrolipoamide acetyltransferase)
MATPVIMPKLGQTVETSIIISWKKQVGDQVVKGEPLCEVETDKAVMEVESPASGTLLDVFFQEGDDVPVLTHIAAIGETGEDISSLHPDSIGDEKTTTPRAATDEEVAPDSISVDAPREYSQEVPTFQDAGAVLEIETGVSPRARNLAKEREVRLIDVQGTGPGGRIIERDVLAVLESRQPTTPLAAAIASQRGLDVPVQGTGIGGRVTTRDLFAEPAPQVGVPEIQADGDEVVAIPVRGVRGIIAERMLSSLQTTAQLTLNASADARALLAYRKRLKNSPEQLGLQKVSINDLILYVVSRTLVQHSELNALYQEDTIYQYRKVHLAFAVDTPRGLIVPVIHNANRLSLEKISLEAERLSAACLDGKISPDELSGGTFTVSNLGVFGIENFTPILNPPQVGILGVGNVNLKPVERDGEVEFIPHLGLSLTINHQAVDGAPGARFLRTLSEGIAQIDLLLAL